MTISTKSASVARMRAHIDHLLNQHSITVNWISRPVRSRASRIFEEVWIAPVASFISYATALHEIGHVLGKNQDSRVAFTRERGAWRWAKRNAIVWDDRLERHMQRQLDSHETNPRSPNFKAKHRYSDHPWPSGFPMAFAEDSAAGGTTRAGGAPALPSTSAAIASTIALRPR